MRTLMNVIIPVADGNAALKNGSLAREIRRFVEERKPEAAYFTTNANGERSGFFVFDFEKTSDMVPIAEPLFMQFNARVTFCPVMNAEDLTAGISEVEKSLAAPA